MHCSRRRLERLFYVGIRGVTRNSKGSVVIWRRSQKLSHVLGDCIRSEPAIKVIDQNPIEKLRTSGWVMEWWQTENVETMRGMSPSAWWDIHGYRISASASGSAKSLAQRTGRDEPIVIGLQRHLAHSIWNRAVWSPLDELRRHGPAHRENLLLPKFGPHVQTARGAACTDRTTAARR
eukprot:SAG31_NODE_1796_length_7245_cov_57.374195_6_plen_178_part_00